MLLFFSLSLTFDIPPDFNVVIDPVSNETLSEKTLIRKAKNKNIRLMISRQRLSVEQMNLELIAAEKQPTIFVGGSYDFNFSNNPAEAFIIYSNNRDLAANVTMNWTVFDGSRKIRRQNTRLKLANEKSQIHQLELQLERDIRNAFSNYQNALFILEVEKKQPKPI